MTLAASFLPSQARQVPRLATLPPMTPYHKRRVFVVATTRAKGARKRWHRASQKPMADNELAAMIMQELSGFFAEPFGRGRYRLLYRCDRWALKLWAVRRQPLPLDGKPLLNRTQLLALAREVYSIRDPDNPQPRLL